jgi:phenylalanyl-tRNA synthetase alpha chain
VLASGAIKNEEINAAIAGARRNQWIQLIDGKIIPTPFFATQSPEEIFLENMRETIEVSKLTDEEKRALEQLKKRPNFMRSRKKRIINFTYGRSKTDYPRLSQENLERRLTTELISSGKWKETKFGALDVEASAPIVYPGRRHPLIEIIEEVKEIFIGLGFSEIEGPIIQSGFWNFDALFTPQDHPAREMQDTFYISVQKQPSLQLKIKFKNFSVHKQRWNRLWDAKKASGSPPHSHYSCNCPTSCKGQVRGWPIFLSGQGFRNEKVSYKHLVEFHQVEGVATAPNASLRELMGLQKEFYSKMGIKRIKFWPTFFPYTEPSLQSMVYNERLKKWVELFGMGIFRPEVTIPLGIKTPVLAWGGGLERIAMLRFGLDDVRELYGNKLGWLRSVPRCQL